MTKFKKFLHVERLGKEEVEGILAGTCYITPKMDGTNSSIWFDADKEEWCAGSRTRELSTEKDNAGFYAWVQSDNEEASNICGFVKEYPYITVFGEFGCGKVAHIKDYDEGTVDTFWVFDMYDNVEEHYLRYEDIVAYAEEYRFADYVVPLLAKVDNPTEEELLEIAQKNTFRLTNANHAGEGIVIRNYDFRNRWGHFEIAKIVLDEFIQNKRENKKKKNAAIENIEQAIADKYVTDAEMAKAKAKTALHFEAEEFDKTQGKMIGFYLNTVMRDAVLEETADWVKRMRNPIVDFSVLQNLVYQKARKYIGL